MRVLPGLRGSGIGTRLMAACEEELQRRGFSSVRIGVEKENLGARRLYEKLGYHAAGELHDRREYVGGDGVARILATEQWVLEKPLAKGAA